MNLEDAEEYTQSLGQIVSGSWRQIMLAKRLGVPQALGMSTEQWVHERLGGYVKLSIEDRRAAVNELAAEGMSQREIGGVLGVDQKTISNDVRSEEDSSKCASNDSHVEEISSTPKFAGCRVKDLHTAVAEGRKFGCVYADPPWLYDNQSTRGATSNHYDSLTIEQLCELPVRDLAADDCHLHLWTTNAFLFECPKLFEAWGFEFRSSFVWVKPQIGTGNYWRNSHEFLLTAIRGDAKRFNDRSLQSWIECDRGRHSQKPEQVRAMIERASIGPYLELFARAQATGWTVWGDEVAPNLFHVPELVA